MFNNQYFSPSKIKSFETCPRQYYQEYILKAEGVDTLQIDTLEGSALHRFADKYEVGINVDKLIKECFKKYGIKYDSEDISIALAIQNITKFKESISTKTKEQEKEYVFEISEGIFLKGIVDLLFLEGEDLNIVDYKSSAKKADRHRQQLQMYSYLAHRESQRNPVLSNCGIIKSKIFYVRLGECSEEITMGQKELNSFVYETLQKIKIINSCGAFTAIENFMCRYCKHQKGCPTQKA